MNKNLKKFLMYFPPVRKLVDQRDKLNQVVEAQKQQLDQLNQVIGAQKQQIDQLSSQVRHGRILHHQPDRNNGTVGITTLSPDEPNDLSLVSRIARAYKKAILTDVGSGDSMWLNQIRQVNEETHKILEGEDIHAIANMLRNPTNSMLFYGFDNNFQRNANKVNEVSWWGQWLKLLAYDSLLQLCRAIGSRRVEYPEAGIVYDEAPDVELLLEELDIYFGFKIDFPNIFAGEIGLLTSRGVANIRAIYALHQAYRIRELIVNKSTQGWVQAKVIEIGAGLGRTAYYAYKMGVKSYTIIDLPLTNVAQAYYLGRIISPDHLSLYGENNQNSISILPPISFKELKEDYDLIVNVDSLTEMAKETAINYLNKSSKISPLFLSINHEYNSFTVNQLLQGRDDVKFLRFPYWLRRGYVEEIIEFIKTEN